MIEYFVLFLAIPLGWALAKITKTEKKIYSKAPYFPIILWALAIATAIFYTLNRGIAITLTFIFLTTLVWNKA
jgi:hypothetical protein